MQELVAWVRGYRAARAPVGRFSQPCGIALQALAYEPALQICRCLGSLGKPVASDGASEGCIPGDAILARRTWAGAGAHVLRPDFAELCSLLAIFRLMASQALFSEMARAPEACIMQGVARDSHCRSLSERSF